MGIALILLMAGFIKICSVHTPSSNPKLPPPKPLPGKAGLVPSPLLDAKLSSRRQGVDGRSPLISRTSVLGLP